MFLLRFSFVADEKIRERSFAAMVSFLPRMMILRLAAPCGAMPRRESHKSANDEEANDMSPMDAIHASATAASSGSLGADTVAPVDAAAPPAESEIYFRTESPGPFGLRAGAPQGWSPISRIEL